MTVDPVHQDLSHVIYTNIVAKGVHLDSNLLIGAHTIRLGNEFVVLLVAVGVPFVFYLAK